MSRRTTLRRRAVSVAAGVLALAACGRAPTPVTQPIYTGPDGSRVAPQPAGPSLNKPSHVATPSETVPQAQPGPIVAPVAPPTVALPLAPEIPPMPLVPITPGPRLIAFTSELDWNGITFASFSPFSLTGFAGLFVYDDMLKDNYALPGAGLGVRNPEIFDNGTKVLFDRIDGTIWFYDVLAELNVQFNDTNTLGVPVIRPSINETGTIMTFVAVPAFVYNRGIAMIWMNGVVAEISKVNAVGALRGGISWIRVSGNGTWATFTTGDGGLFVYDVFNPTVYEVLDARVAGGFATHPDISFDGSQVVWTGIDPGDGTLKIFRYDRIGGLVDPMPFANVAMNAIDTFDPEFLTPDGTWFVYGAFIGSRDGGFRVLAYNWLTEAVRTLTILNNVIGDGINLISDLDD
ncbi:MAG: hypothetical protein FJZ01_23080 [Candidatus Sericytochromatia bacterium]|nr:hypothetical protein [Candidatus Tanganyikabacteria bacterium]